MRKEKSKILNEIKENSNNYTADVILDYINNKVISEDDLLSIGIPKVVIDNLKKENNSLRFGEFPVEINNGYTEIYLWGLPGSGKTCVLSAILNTGVTIGDIELKEGPVHQYMSQLSNIFLKKCSVLPPSTHLDNTEYLPFDLYDDNKKKHPFALIELPNVLFRANVFQNNLEPLDAGFKSIFNRTIEYLKGPNKKIHFFIIDITKDSNNLDFYDLTQQQYLKNLLNFFDRYNLFKNTTEGIYIILTKSDVLSKNESERMNLAIDYLKENYHSFIYSLKSLISKSGLTKSIKVIPFSIGEVYFRELCLFDNINSLELINLFKFQLKKKRGLFFKKLWIY